MSTLFDILAFEYVLTINIYWMKAFFQKLFGGKREEAKEALTEDQQVLIGIDATGVHRLLPQKSLVDLHDQ